MAKDPSAFRAHLRKSDDPRIAGIEKLDAYSWAERTLANPRAAALFGEWMERYRGEDFHGITTDGSVIPGLFSLADENAPVPAVAQAADALLQKVSVQEKQKLCHPVDAREWRGWMNPEVYINRFGLRLEEADAGVREAILGVVRASMSAQGFEKARNMMRINNFLGELVGAPRVMNEWSYNFNLFGTPSSSGPWGWNLYGHHLCVNCLMLGRQMAMTPVFMGAEPNCIDAGPLQGLSVFDDQERMGLDLMRSLPAGVQGRAQLFSKKRDSAMPAGRIAIGDELHLGGAFRDNRVVPYEGACADGFDAPVRRALLDLIASYLSYLPEGPFAARMQEAERHLSATHFCWIGGTDDESPFYYRIQSPALMIEFDHHAGVFLGNSEPEKFHIHTVIRTPNGNDYGMAWVRRHCELARAGARPG